MVRIPATHPVATPSMDLKIEKPARSVRIIPAAMVIRYRFESFIFFGFYVSF